MAVAATPRARVNAEESPSAPSSDWRSGPGPLGGPYEFVWDLADEGARGPGLPSVRHVDRPGRREVAGRLALGARAIAGLRG